MEVGKRIGQYLQDRGIKQAFLANTTGISASAISDICTGARKNLDVVEYKKICNALDVPYETFLED
jgi:transcriptional regulator with XRE-family HTH domain